MKTVLRLLKIFFQMQINRIGIYLLQGSGFRSSRKQILIEARDYLGNSVSRTIQVQAAGPVKIRSALVVPNPNYGNGNLQVSFNRAVQAYDLGLYDSSGSFISRFSGGTLNSNGRISLEPLLTSNLANGVYLLKLKVTDSSNRTDRKIVKFIILEISHILN